MMNELDNLKNAWKTISEAEPTKGYTADELKKIVKRKSNNELLKIKRKFIMEWSAAILLSVFIVVFVKFVNQKDTSYALIFVAFILLVSFFPYLNIIKVKSSSHSNLKNHLSEFISGFEKLVKQYMKIATFLLPIAIIGGLLLGTHSSMPAEKWEHFFTVRTIAILLVIVVLLSVASYLIQKRYFNWVYGKNLKRLKACLSELESVEEVNE